MSTAATAPKAGTAPRRILAVASGKGGVGKTWFSVTLAQALAASHRTLLFDGDLGLANIDIQLGLSLDRDLASVISGKATLAQIVAPCPQGGFDILAGRSGAGNLASLSAAQLNNLMAQLATVATGYERIILDLGAGIEPTVRTLAASADTTIIVTTDDPTALTDAYAFIKVTALRDPSAHMAIVINLAENHNQGRRTYETLLKACQNFLKLSPPLLGVIRRDRLVREAIRAQMPLLTRSPNCDAANDVAAAAKQLAELR